MNAPTLKTIGRGLIFCILFAIMISGAIWRITHRSRRGFAAPQSRVSVDWVFNTNGLDVTVPSDPKGKAIYQENRADWNINGVTLTADKQPDGTFKLLRNGQLLGTAREGEHVEFTADGRLIHHPKTPTPPL